MARQASIRLRKRGCSSGHGWGFIAADVEDPPQCIAMCRERFLRELLPKDETFERACEALGDRGGEQQQQHRRSFRALYCCDSQLCGVDNLGERGRDPNVNWFINACQEIGYHSIVDPGPPDVDYVCDPESTHGGDVHCHKAQPADRAEDEAFESVSSTSQVSTSEDATSKRSTASETSTSAPVQSSMSDTTYSTSTDPSLVTTSEPSSKEQDKKDETGLPLGVKVTIAILSVVILAALVVLVVCLLKRRKSRRNDIRRLIKHPTSPPPADSPTPLVSPTLSHTDADGVPLTPPARLRERKFLPTLSEPSLSPTSSRHRDRSGFPASPLCSPTSSNLTPRHERTPKIYSADQVPPVPMIVMTTPEGGQNDGSASFNGVTPPASVQKMPLGHGNGSPPRPPRSRDGLFRILVSPGPPPTRALPSTPPNRPSTPTKPLSSPPRKGSTVCPPVHQLTKDIVLSPEARELRDMTESYAKDAGRHSGGSWSGMAGSSLAKGRSVSSPVMEEADLERLGGRY
ncbi:hypothetical protein CEP52_016382 [Fusarium oligoseptatum]|uniref:Uncharacterized protein n=1 Tax=Fusarium oligoseptatum TaxID=2604345 RepID=A0A428S4N1_9HYPO|nr:hypothetical protein CEP52_016382 [Fusarium oligoseptatum]